MAETKEIKEFDIEQFKAELIPVRDDFGTNSYITWGTGSSKEVNDAKKARAAELHEQLLDMCAEALLTAADKADVEKLIHDEIIWHSYGTGHDMIGGSGRTEFWQKLAMIIAQKATEKTVEPKTDVDTIATSTQFKAGETLKRSEVLAEIEIEGKQARIIRIAPDDISDLDLTEHARNLAIINAAPRKDIPNAAEWQKEREAVFTDGWESGLLATEEELNEIYPDMSEEEHFRAYSRRGTVENNDQGAYTRRMSQGHVFGIEIEGRIASVQAYDKLGKTKDNRPVLEFSKASTLEQYKGKRLNPKLKKLLAELLEQEEGNTPIWCGSSVNKRHLEKFQERGWHLTTMNDPKVEAVQIAYQHGKEYIDKNMIPQGYRAVYADPLVDRIKWEA